MIHYINTGQEKVYKALHHVTYDSDETVCGIVSE